MRRFLGLALAASTALLIPSFTSMAPATAAGNTHAGDGDKTVCANASAGYAHCDAHVRTHRGTAKPHATVSRSGGFISTDLRSAYALTTSSTNAVAIVDANANPNAASDLAAYRAGSGLPALTSGQFTQYSQTGGAITTVPSDVGWGQEEMLDLEMVSAVCPSCKIVYVGANSASFTDLAAAVDLAATKGVKAISNSYGGGEYSTEGTDQSHYHHDGIAITVSSGDSGYGVEFPPPPATSPPSAAPTWSRTAAPAAGPRPPGPVRAAAARSTS